MIVLGGGVDSLYWSARATVGDWYVEGLRARDRARIEGAPVPWRDLRGYALDVLGRSWRGYALVVSAAEFELRFTDSERLPTVYVQLHASFIHSVGAEQAMVESVAAAAAITGGIGVATASRIDPYVDVSGFELRAGDRRGFHTRGEVTMHADGNDDDEALPSVLIGAKGLKVRIYDKRRELQKKGKPVPLEWGDFAAAVWRVEVECRSVALRRFGIQTVGDALSSFGDVWRYATTRFFVLRVPGVGPRRSWPVRAEWRAIQEAGAVRFPANGLIPFSQLKGEKVRVLQQLWGNLVSLGAFQGCFELDAVIASLRRELRSVERGRDYAKLAELRRRRLPAVVRERLRP